MSTPPKRRVLIPSGALMPPASLNGVEPKVPEPHGNSSWRSAQSRSSSPSQKFGMSTAAMPFCGVVILGCTRAGSSCPYAPVLSIVSCWKNTRPSEPAGTNVTLPTSRLCDVTVPETVIVLMSSGVFLVAGVKAVPVLVHHVHRARTVERQGPPVTLGVRPGHRGRGHGRERRKQLAGFQAFGQGSKRPSRRRWLSHRHGSDTLIPGGKADRPSRRTPRTPIKARPEPNPQRHRKSCPKRLSCTQYWLCVIILLCRMCLEIWWTLSDNRLQDRNP